MKKQFQSFLSLSTFALLMTVGVSLNAQQSAPPATPTDPAATPQTQPTDPTAQQPATTPQSQTGQTPDASTQTAPPSQAQASTASDTQSFTGTIVKAGDKYMFQDASSGNTYDIDHQEEVKQYEGKKVKVHGTLDANGKMIHVQ
jgi:uncharacterized protein YdeI (BOF family)